MLLKSNVLVDGLRDRFIYFNACYKSMVRIGKKYINILKQEAYLKYVHMHKNFFRKLDQNRLKNIKRELSYYRHIKSLNYKRR